MTATFTLAGTEARLLTREWAAMVFAFVFPPLTMLIIAGAFGSQPDEGFGGVIPTDFYIAGYFGIPIGAIALVGVPVALASYRERDVLRRFSAFGIPTRAVVGAQAVVSFGLMVLAALLVLVAAAPTYGLPGVEHPVQVVVGFVAGATTMLVLGVAVGLLVRSARGAQAIGLVLFFPMFLLSGGGPPPDAMGSAMRAVAATLPLTNAISAIRDPWLGTGSLSPHLVGLAAWLLVGLLAAALASRKARA
jgi:ABC-2 type transport system permease protein